MYNQKWDQFWATCFLYLACISHCDLPWGHLSDPVMALCPTSTTEKTDPAGPFATLVPPHFWKSESLSLYFCLNAPAFPSSNETLQCSVLSSWNRDREETEPKLFFPLLKPKRRKELWPSQTGEGGCLHQTHIATMIARPPWHTYFPDKTQILLTAPNSRVNFPLFSTLLTAISAPQLSQDRYVGLNLTGLNLYTLPHFLRVSSPL